MRCLWLVPTNKSIQNKSINEKATSKIDGKVKSIEKSGTGERFDFTYNGLGNRIAKTTVDALLTYYNAKAQYYTLDAQGNVLAVHDLSEQNSKGSSTKTFSLKEHHLFGSSRLGMEQKNLLLFYSKAKADAIPIPDRTIQYTLTNYFNNAGDKRYELSNHLGDVLSVVNDKKIPGSLNTLSYFYPDGISYNDYYPFGMLVPNRHGSSDSYRYGFNGKELDNEIKGEGNSYDFGARMLDPRVGRWFSTDALEGKYPYLSPYNFAENNPIVFTDPDGKDAIITIRGNNITVTAVIYIDNSGKNKINVAKPKRT